MHMLLFVDNSVVGLSNKEPNHLSMRNDKKKTFLGGAEVPFCAYNKKKNWLVRWRSEVWSGGSPRIVVVVTVIHDALLWSITNFVVGETWCM